MNSFREAADDYARIERAISFIEENAPRQPSLEEVAAEVSLSEFHFQRLFSRWVGISPKRFLQYLTKEHAKKLLENSSSVFDAAYQSGLSGPSRLHDLLVNCEAVTPGEVRKRGTGLEISYGFHPSPFGTCMIAVTGRGLCGLKFTREDADEQDLAAWLRRLWPAANLRPDEARTGPYLPLIFSSPGEKQKGPLYLYVRGTNFQIQVWQALLRIPFGEAVCYEDIAQSIGLPHSSRAVGNAVGSNPIPYLIPCHRVLRKAGEFGNYGEGPSRKKAILCWESALRERSSTSNRY